jgi:hypothetical protein
MLYFCVSAMRVKWDCGRNTSMKWYSMFSLSLCCIFYFCVESLCRGKPVKCYCFKITESKKYCVYGDKVWKLLVRSSFKDLFWKHISGWVRFNTVIMNFLLHRVYNQHDSVPICHQFILHNGEPSWRKSGRELSVYIYGTLSSNHMKGPKHTWQNILWNICKLVLVLQERNKQKMFVK